MAELQPSQQFYKLFDMYNNLGECTTNTRIKILKDIILVVRSNTKHRGKSYAEFPSGITYSDVRYIINELIGISTEMYNNNLKHHGFKKIEIHIDFDIVKFFAQQFKKKFGLIKLLNEEHIKYIMKCHDYILRCSVLPDDQNIIAYVLNYIRRVYHHDGMCELCNKVCYKKYKLDNCYVAVICEKMDDFVVRYYSKINNTMYFYKIHFLKKT